MTHLSLSAYWAAISQVIPVVALAFVIEARMIVRRLSKKTAFKKRGARIRWSVVFFLLATLLAVSEYVALRSLSSSGRSDFTWIDAVYYWLSLVAVIASLLIVVSLPVASMVSASTGDVFRWIEVHIPWSSAQKLRRLILRQLEDVERVIRNSQGARLDALMMCATVLLDRDVDLGSIQKALNRALTGQEPRYVEFLDPTGALRRHVHSNPSEELWGYRVGRLLYDNLVLRQRDMRRLRKQLRRQLRRLEKLTSMDSREFAKIQRANMAAAAQLP
ncbi:hypothetical protein AB0O14_18680 [Microbacterium foliorum]